MFLPLTSFLVFTLAHFFMVFLPLVIKPLCYLQKNEVGEVMNPGLWILVCMGNSITLCCMTLSVKKYIVIPVFLSCQIQMQVTDYFLLWGSCLT